MGDNGVSVSEKCLINCINVHTDDCDQGIFVQALSEIWVSGGIYKWTTITPLSGSSLIKSIFNNKHFIGYQFNDENGLAIPDTDVTGVPQLSSVVRQKTGFVAQEGSTGHVNATITNFTSGMLVTVNSRANCDRSQIHVCSFGIELEHGGNVGTASVDFGVGTGNRNLQASISYRGGVEVQDNYIQSQPVHKIGEHKGPTTHTGDTLETQIGPTLYTIPDYAFFKNGTITIKVFGSISGTAGNKVIVIELGGSNVASLTFVAAATGGFVAELGIKALEDTSQASWGWGIAGGVTATAGSSDATVLTVTRDLGDGTASALDFNVQLGNAADSITINAIEVFRYG
jgi:hypothetical protein